MQPGVGPVSPPPGCSSPRAGVCLLQTRVYDSMWQLPPTCLFTGRRDPSAGSASGSCLCLGEWGLAGGRRANLFFFFGKFKGKKREEEEEKEVRPLGGLVRNPAHGRPL